MRAPFSFDRLRTRIGLPLIWMDPDDHYRCTITAIYWVSMILPMPAIILMMSIVPAASMARKNAAGAGEQGDDAY